MAGASGAFIIGRTLGREFAASLIGDKLKRYDDAIERNGLATVLYLRLIYFPFTPMNFGMGLTKVHFWDYFFGTGLGIIVGTFIYLFFVGTVREVWISGNWGQLLSYKVFFSVALFVFSLFIPKIIKKDTSEIAAAKAMMGKNIIVTDNDQWSTEEIVKTSLDRSRVEQQFRLSKASCHVRVNPMFHWTDSKIR
jgi:hypothetical protein